MPPPPPHSRPENQLKVSSPFPSFRVLSLAPLVLRLQLVASCFMS